MSTNKITCSFTVDRDIYNAYKSIVVKGGENVKGNLIRYMLNVINYETPNADKYLVKKPFGYSNGSYTGPDPNCAITEIQQRC